MSWWRKASAVDNGSHNINGWIKIQSIWRKASISDTISSASSSNPWIVDGWLRIKTAWRYAGAGLWDLIFTSLSVPAPLVPYPYLVAVNTDPDNPMLQPNTKLYTTRGYWAEEPINFNIQIQEKPPGGSWSAIQTHIKNYDEYLSSDGLDQFPPLASNRYTIPKSRVRQGYSYRTKHVATNAQNLEGTYITEAIMPRMTHGPIINTFTVSNETSYGAKFSWTLDGNVVDSPVEDLFKQTIRIYDYETDELIYDDDVLINQQTITINEPTLLETGVTYTAEITVICQDGWSSTANPTQDFMRVDFTTGVSLPGPVRNVVATQTSGRPYNNAEITVTWSPPLLDPQAVDYYRVQYAYVNSSGNYGGVTWNTLSDTWPNTSITSSPYAANYGGYFVTHKIWSHNSAGYTLTSVTSNEILTSTKAEKPVILNATKASNTSISVYFDPLWDYGGNKGDGGSVTTYRLYATSDTGQFNKLITTSPTTITGLTANKSYELKIKATNNEGDEYSDGFILDITDRTPVATPVSAVLSLQAGPAGRPGSTYRITAPSFTNLPTEYYFQYEVNNQGANSYVNSGWISNSYWDYTFLTETSNTLSGIVYARNIYATSAGVYTSTSVPVLKYKPSDPTITTSSTTSSWSIGVVFGANTTSVEIEYGSTINYGTIATLTSSRTFTPVGPFPSNTTYYYRITPFNSSSPGDSITGSVTTQVILTAPGPARNVSIQNVAFRSYGEGQISISWEAPLNNGGSAIDYYRVQYAYDYDLSTWYTLSDTWAATSMTAGPFPDSYTIRAKVFAHNAQGYSVSEVSPAPGAYINTKAEAPSLLTATKSSSTSIATTFTPSIIYGGTKNTGGSDVIYYLRTSSILGPTSKQVTTSPSTITGLTAGYDYTVFIRASNDQGTVDSNTITVGLVNAPSLISAPEVTPSSGTAGSTQYSTTNGSWSGSPTGYTYSWRYRETSVIYPAAPGTNNQSTYTPPANFVSLYGNTLRCVVTAINGGGSTPANSNDVTVSAPVSAPVGSVSISPSGTVQARTQITATSSFTNSPTSSYIEIRKATGANPTQSSTLVTSSASTQVSHTITDSEASGTPDRFIAFAYASNSGGTSPTYSSNIITSTPYVPPALAPTGGSASVSPASGTYGSTTFTASTSGWSGSQTITYAYSWQRFLSNGSWQEVATGSTFSPTVAQGTTALSWRLFVTASNGISPNGTATATFTVQNPTVAIPSGGSVTLTGTSTVGSIISAATSGWSPTPTSYETIITTALYPTIPTDLSTVVATGTTSASYTITSNDAISPENIFRSFARATNSSGTSSYVSSTNTITATAANTPPFFPPHFPPFFPPFFPPHFPPFFPPHFPPFFPPFFPPHFPPFFPPHFPSTTPAVPTGLTAYLSGSNTQLSWNAVSGATSYELYWGTSATKPSSSATIDYPQPGQPLITSEVFTAPISNQYYWFIRARNSAGVSGWSNGAFTSAIGPS
jgi:hypothetical protein